MSLVVLCLAVLLSGCAVPPPPVQQPYVIGLMTNNPNGLRNVQGFVDGMTDLGYIEGENVRYLSAGEPIPDEQLEEALRAMVDAGVDLIFTAGTPTGVAAHKVTACTDIPVVFGVIADPVTAGVLTDLTRPGGNMTGVKLNQTQGRRLELLQEFVPHVRRVLVPFNPNDPAPANAFAQIRSLAPRMGIELIEAHAYDDEEVATLLADFPSDVDAIFLLPDSTVNRHLADLLRVAHERKLPVSGPSTAQVEEGALMTYGFVHHRVGEQAARMADQILQGVKPGDLPVEETEFYLAFNLVTAAEIGLEIPYQALQQAEIIIRPDNDQ